MSKAIDKKIESFTLWMNENSISLYEGDITTAADSIEDELLKIDAQLGVEVAGEDEEGIREVIVTAFSDSSKFPIIDQLVSFLPEISNWKFVALKPPRGFAFKLAIEDYEFDINTLQFSPIQDAPNSFQLLISSKVLETLPVGGESEEIAWLIVETGIGEKMASQIQHLEFMNDESSSDKYPISELENHIKER